ncbi:DUF1801 domain-containing protein [Dyadobacter sp.]|uniref:DUF1801 domain-containing protein n=1 Tax=Dyadobacter sp. TaxID=1914288 RepID=UPI003F70450D
MQLKDIDQYFWNHPEPTKSFLAALRHFILHYKPGMTEVWRYSMPFYLFEGSRICYIWIEKKTGRPYLGIVNGNRIEHPNLIAEKRTRMKILLLDPVEDLAVDVIGEILQLAIRLK